MKVFQGRQRGTGIRLIGEFLPQVLKKTGISTRLKSQRAIDAWRKAAGEEVGKHARAIRLRGARLLVEVDSAARLQELRNFTGEKLRYLANRILGTPLIAKIEYHFTTDIHG